MLNGRGFTRGWVDGIHHDVIFAADVHVLPIDRRNTTRTIDHIHKTPVGMRVYRAGTLAPALTGDIRQRGFDISRLCIARRRIGVQAIHVQQVLPLQRGIQPRFRGMKIDVPRAEAVTTVGRYRLCKRKLTIRVTV